MNVVGAEWFIIVGNQQDNVDVYVEDSPLRLRTLDI